MAENKRYNGWKNYQTWNVALWLGNDEGLYRSFRDAAAEKKFTSESVEEWVREAMPGGTPDLKERGRGGRDAYAGVNWREIRDMVNEP